jgi:hypothetical protein
VTSSARSLAIVLLLVEGLSGVGVGLTLLPGMLSTNAGSTGLAIAAGTLGYGAALSVAAIGILRGRGWGWWLGIAAIAAGLALLVVLVVMTRGDGVLLGGVLIWIVTLGALLVGWRSSRR